MSFASWLGNNWLPLAQLVMLTTGVGFCGMAVLLDARARRVSNLIQLTQQHRDLWERMYLQPELARIRDQHADIVEEPISSAEEMFVIFIILHLSSTYCGMTSGFFQRPHGLRQDIEHFFCLPIPKAVWAKVKHLQDPRFVAFVDQCLPEESTACEDAA